jgi:hypothetical protein
MASSPKGGSRFRDRENVRHAVLLVGDAAPVCCAAMLARAQIQEIDELKKRYSTRTWGAAIIQQPEILQRAQRYEFLFSRCAIASSVWKNIFAQDL